MAHLYLVRHAKAGERRAWHGDDRLRPLSKAGWRQADGLAERFAKLQAPALLSSPSVRCVQTLEPLAALLHLDVTADERLTEGAPFEPLLDLLATADDDTIMCAHGDLIPDTVAALQRRGTEIRTPPDWRKASTWVFKRNRHGDIVHATSLPPPKR